MIRLLDGWRLVSMFVVSPLVSHIAVAQAGFDYEHPISGIRSATPALDDAAIRTRCPAFVVRTAEPSDELPADTVPIRRSCRVTGVVRLPSADGASWLAATYERAIIFPADSARRRMRRVDLDTLVLVSAVLYSAATGTARWRAEWHGVVVQRDIDSVSIALAKRAGGTALVSVRYCWNGTGGCWQEFLHRRAARWTAVTQVYREQLPPIRDGSIGKGEGIDVATLRGSFGVYGPHDGNCCPSRDLFVTLDLHGDSLVLKSSRVRPARE